MCTEMIVFANPFNDLTKTTMEHVERPSVFILSQESLSEQSFLLGCCSSFRRNLFSFRDHSELIEIGEICMSEHRELLCLPIFT